jgi:integrase
MMCATRPPAAPSSPQPGSSRTSGAGPFTAGELEEVWSDWSGYSPVLADVMLVLARTGLRWSEARALTVADADPEQLVVDKSASERGPLRRLADGQARRVPVPTRVRPVVRRLVAARDADELLFTTSLGGPLRRDAVLRRLNWSETAHGRRLEDLRTTAAALWLAEGVAPVTVREWMGPTRLAG